MGVGRVEEGGGSVGKEGILKGQVVIPIIALFAHYGARVAGGGWIRLWYIYHSNKTITIDGIYCLFSINDRLQAKCCSGRVSRAHRSQAAA